MSDPAFDDLRRWAPVCLAALFAGSGTLHLGRAGLYLPLVPRVLPARDGIVLASGVAELACAAGLLMHARWASLASTLLLVAVFPANVAYAISAASARSTSPLVVAVAWGRLPLQVPLIWAALQARRQGS